MFSQNAQTERIKGRSCHFACFICGITELNLTKFGIEGLH